MNTEHATAELFAALAAAQGEIENASKNMVNGAFAKNNKPSYADLAEVMNTIRDAWPAHGLSLVQSTAFDGSLVHVTTLIAHKTGGYLTMTASCMPAKTDAQGIGAATTYLRRYGAAAAAGIAQEDDDGNAASHSKKPAAVAQLSAGTPTSGAWESMDTDEQAFLQKIADEVVSIIATGDVLAAHDHLASQNLAAEEKIALWTRLDSKTRSALKRADAALKTTEEAA